jgi:beta-xylosidase
VLNRTAIQDSCARGTNAINFVSGMSNSVDMMGIWYGSDAIDVFYDTRKLIYGSAGILTKDGIKKPVFYAFRFLRQLGGELVKTGNNYIMTKDSSGRIVCLCYNQRAYSYYYYFKDVTDQKDLSKLFQSEERVILEMEIADLEKDGEYLIKEEVVNSLNGSIQDEWKTLGNQVELGKSEIQYLRNVCIPKIFMKQFTCVEGRLSFHIELEPHEMRLIHISPY